ncbi:hypothetical protein IGI04_029530 [Brassica rapa subsp. trilocularis]|uniref:Uncharacterized protein n=1 Tax=Brassica rapa subsp. trilocularis TaxID=1813537 RepID=A0ABQ7LRA5_BRACM|nr:hypothetical protein IGI04_029530 [Brassica rapa subsp. trilocularis]
MPLPYLFSTIQSSRDLQCFRKLSAPKYQMIAFEPDLNWSPLLIDSQKFLGLATEKNVIASNLENFLWAVLNDTLRVDVTNATMECWKKVQEGSKEGNTAAGGHRLQLLYC